MLHWNGIVPCCSSSYNVHSISTKTLVMKLTFLLLVSRHCRILRRKIEKFRYAKLHKRSTLFKFPIFPFQFVDTVRTVRDTFSSPTLSATRTKFHRKMKTPCYVTRFESKMRVIIIAGVIETTAKRCVTTLVSVDHISEKAWLSVMLRLHGG